MKSICLVLPILTATLTLMSMEQPSQQWNGKEYDNNSEMQRKAAMEIVTRLQIAPTEHILDIGCGPGPITFELAKRVPQGSVHGIDASESQIEQAQQKFTEQNNLTFAVANAQQLEYNNRFDRCVSFAAIHWMQNHQAVFDGCYRALKPGGYLNFTMRACANEDEVPLLRAFRQTAQQKQWQGLLAGLDPNKLDHPSDKETVEQQLKKSGFENVGVLERLRTHPFTPEQYQSFLLSLFGAVPQFKQLKQSDPEKIKNLIAAIVAKYIENEPLDDKGMLNHKFIGLVVSGRKPLQ